jgi:hypothetical protein
MSEKTNNQSETIVYLNIMSVKIARKTLLHTDFTPKIFIQIGKRFSIFNEHSFYFNKRFSTLKRLFDNFLSDMQIVILIKKCKKQ